MERPSYGPWTPRKILASTPFVLCHLVPFAAIWTGVSWQTVTLAVALYFVRMFWVTAGYHRYFAHRSFKTGRVMQFVFAFLAQTSAEKGSLWWAAHHRDHHRFSDAPGDVHSPRLQGFFHSHMGWLFAGENDATKWHRIRDFAKYPELVWLNTWSLLPAVVLAVGCFLWMGWEGLVVGFFWSTVALWHGTFTVNSLAHVFGVRDYATNEDSRNSWLIALWTMGEGWHNNHHHYQLSVRQGFRWWQYDPTWWGLELLSVLGLVWDLRKPSEEIVAAAKRGAPILPRENPVRVPAVEVANLEVANLIGG